MANQPRPSRPFFRLPSLVRLAPESVQTQQAAPEPAPVQPRSVMARPAFTPTTQPINRPQEPAPAPPAQKSPAKPTGVGVTSVTSSPVQRTPAHTAALPNSPVKTTTFSGPVANFVSVQSTAIPRVSPPPSSVPSSMVLKPAQTSSVPDSVTVPNAFTGPNSPTPKPPPTTTSMTTSPANKSTTTVAARAPSPPRSPKPTHTSPPPSSSTLPPAAEQKTVLVQKTTNNRTTNSDKDHAKLTNDHAGSIEKAQHKKILWDSEGRGMRVITITGENKGAFMNVIQSSNKKHSDHKTEKRADQLPWTAFVNSNFQGINNSIAYNSSCTHHSPGVHLALFRDSTGNSLHNGRRA